MGSDNINNSASFITGIVGLGLIGGSMAEAMRGFRKGIVLGYDKDAAVMDKALKKGVISGVFEDGREAAETSDLLILCMYPRHIQEYMQTYAPYVKKYGVVTDVCGTKTHLYRNLTEHLPANGDYVGIHPMAGKEIGGFDNAEGDLFQGTGLIITPLSGTSEESIILIKEMAKYIGSKSVICNPDLHDDIIAYTSDLMHISAAALCISYHPKMDSRFTAGAFRDSTRVANINPDLWTELFLLNGEYIIPHLDTYIGRLLDLREAIRKEDKNDLHRLLTSARDNKKEMLKR